MSTNVSDKNSDAVREVSEDQYSYKPRNRSKTTTKQKKPVKINKLAVVIPLCAILVFCIAVITFSMTLPKNKIADNVFAGEIDLSGKTESEAVALIEGLIDEILTFFTATFIVPYVVLLYFNSTLSLFSSAVTFVVSIVTFPVLVFKLAFIDPVSANVISAKVTFESVSSAFPVSPSVISPFVFING